MLKLNHSVTNMTAYFRSICPVHTLRLLSWHGVCACVVVCTLPHLSSFLLVSPSHMLMNCVEFGVRAHYPICPLCFAGNRLSTHALTRACAPSSVHGAGDVWNRVASEVLQLQQEGPLPVGKQLQQHRVRMQAQRHAHAHVGQQGDVCVKGRSARCSGEQEQSRGGVSVSVSRSGEDVFDASCR